MNSGTKRTATSPPPARPVRGASIVLEDTSSPVDIAKHARLHVSDDEVFATDVHAPTPLPACSWLNTPIPAHEDCIKSSSLLTPPPTPPPVYHHAPLDHTSFPHIFDSILALAPRASLLALRRTSRATRNRVDTALASHLILSFPSARCTIAEVRITSPLGKLPSLHSWAKACTPAPPTCCSQFDPHAIAGSLVQIEPSLLPVCRPAPLPSAFNAAVHTACRRARTVDVVGWPPRALLADLARSLTPAAVRYRADTKGLFRLQMAVRAPACVSFTDGSYTAREFQHKRLDGVRRFVHNVSSGEFAPRGSFPEGRRLREVVLVFTPAKWVCNFEPPGGEVVPLGMLSRFAVDVVRYLHQVEFTFVDILEADPLWLGLGAQDKPLSKGLMRLRIVQRLHSLIDDGINKSDWSVDELKDKVERIAFVRREQYRDKIGAEAYAFETVEFPGGEQWTKAIVGP